MAIEITESQKLYPNALSWTAGKSKTTNYAEGNVKNQLLGIGSSLVGSLTGLPQLSQVGSSLTEQSAEYSVKSLYNVGPEQSQKPFPGVKYADFRSRKAKWDGSLSGFKGFGKNASNAIKASRLDGTQAATRGNLKAGIYAAAAASPAGAYSVFNLEGAGPTGYGWGDHDNPYALRNDFTARSHVATRWKGSTKEWKPTLNPLELATPFRGDKVNVIDFGKRALKEAYLWKPKRIKSLGANMTNLTQDFIKFFFTGPKLHAGLKNSTNEEDDIMVFRATIKSLTDNHSGNFTPVEMIGRADSNYHYTGYSRDVSFNFSVHATDKDELKPIWRKLNALAGYTAPIYDQDNIAMIAPYLRFTIGDLFYQQAALLKSVNFTMSDEAPWEINIEDDKTNMQVPMAVEVSITLTIIPDWLPQKGGRFYSLAKQFGEDAQPLAGPDDWLGDTKPNKPKTQEQINSELLRLTGTNINTTQVGTETGTETGDDFYNNL